MPAHTLIDAFVQFNAVDLSDHVRSVTLQTEFEAAETTAMGGLDAAGRKWRTRLAGLGEFSVDVEFNQDFDASKVDATMWAALATVVPIVIRPTSSVQSATNPEFTGDILITQYTPLTGGVGDVDTVSMSWPGTGELTRDAS